MRVKVQKNLSLKEKAGVVVDNFYLSNTVLFMAIPLIISKFPRFGLAYAMLYLIVSAKVFFWNVVDIVKYLKDNLSEYKYSFPWDGWYLGFQIYSIIANYILIRICFDVFKAYIKHL